MWRNHEPATTPELKGHVLSVHSTGTAEMPFSGWHQSNHPFAPRTNPFLWTHGCTNGAFMKVMTKHSKRITAKGQSIPIIQISTFINRQNDWDSWPWNPSMTERVEDLLPRKKWFEFSSTEISTEGIQGVIVTPISSGPYSWALSPSPTESGSIIGRITPTSIGPQN